MMVRRRRPIVMAGPPGQAPGGMLDPALLKDDTLLCLRGIQLA